MKKDSLGLEISNSIISGLTSLIVLISIIMLIVNAKFNYAYKIIHLLIIFISTTLSCIHHALKSELVGKEIIKRISISFYILSMSTYTLLIFNKVNNLIIILTLIINLIQIIMNAIFYKKIILSSVLTSLFIIWIQILIIILLDIFSPVVLFIYTLLGLNVSISLLLYLIGSKRSYCHLLFHILYFIITIIELIFIKII